MSGTVKIRKRRSFSAIPDDILEDTRMRTETRLVLGWLIGRPDGWEVRVGHVQHVLGLSERRWVTVRKELEALGYLRQIRRRNAEGKFLWEHIVSDTPMISDPEPEGDESSIPPKPQDGPEARKTIPPKPMHGSSMHGQRGDITTSSHQENLNTPPPYPLPEGVAITQACHDEAAERFRGYSIEALEDEWQKAVQRRGEIPRNPDKAFLAWAAVYASNHPLPYGGGF